ncbi:ABC transporter permease subunit [Eubacteriales bacterium mix99]|jgi:putative aldouronate transport system permease protein|nr:sugar ABC transporter permease [Clostridiales bacterium]
MKLNSNYKVKPGSAIPVVNTLSDRIIKELSKNKYLYLMALPVLAYYLLFHYGPMYGAVIAFKNFDVSKGIWGSPWVGFQYFREFFQSYYFSRLLRNTFLLSFYQLLWGFPAPILFALLLNEIRNHAFKRTIQTAAYLPHFISTVVVCGLIHDFFARDGVITSLYTLFGGEATSFLSQPQYFRGIYVGTGIWQETGWGAIIYLSALSSIDTQQYEAAIIDGAGRLKQLLHVTLPGIMPTIIIMLILRIGQVMSVGFEKIILLYNPNTYETADVISSFVYRKGLGESFQFSYTSAVGLFNSLINFALLISANWFSKKVSDTSLW